MNRNPRCVFGRPLGRSQRRLPAWRRLLPHERLFLAAVALPLTAWLPAVAAPPAYLADPADPDRRVPPLLYESVTGGTKSFRPVDPKGWAQQNKDVAPRPGEEGMGGMDHGSMKGMSAK